MEAIQLVSRSSSLKVDYYIDYRSVNMAYSIQIPMLALISQTASYDTV
jgi:hypothetical protein